MTRLPALLVLLLTLSLTTFAQDASPDDDATERGAIGAAGTSSAVSTSDVAEATRTKGEDESAETEKKPRGKKRQAKEKVDFGQAAELILVPLLKPGDTSERVYEVQATLNRELHRAFPDGSICLDDFQGSYRCESEPSGIKDDFGNPKMVPKLVLSEDNKLTLRHDRSNSWTVEGDTLSFPEEPLAVDGVYGEQTYAAVLLFQLQNNLRPTGKVDAVTLDKLEPLVPANWLLAATMDWVEGWEFIGDLESPILTKRVTAAVVVAMMLIASVIVLHFSRVLANAPRFLDRWLFTESTSPWFRIFRENKVFLNAAQFGPAGFICLAAFMFFPEPDSKTEDALPYLNTFQNCHVLLLRFGMAYLAFVATLVSLAIANSFHDIYTADQPADNPIEGIIRAVKRIIAAVGLVLICSGLMGKNPMYIVGGLGAFMAVIMLVFRDSLLGLAASIQIIANRMVAIGDWIEMPKYGADGDVLKISLSTVKVQNFDNTISTIPTYAMLSESFRNWSGMRHAGARRIKRSVNIDMDSIRVCTDEMIDRFEAVELISDYVREKKKELAQHNLARDVEASQVNSRQMTNIGTFRAYLEAYLSNHPMLSSEMTFLVRHLQPTKEGLPIEIYAFCTDPAWKAFETIQSDIMDHVLSILPEFGLRAFQEVSSTAATSRRDKPDDQREAQIGALRQFVQEQNVYLSEHPSARVGAAKRRVDDKIGELGLTGRVSASSSGRRLELLDV